MALDKAKIQLMTKPDSTFFTTVCFSLKHVWDTHIPTACTNGKEIRMNPSFFMGLAPEERVFLLLHESMHVAYLHMDRLMDRDAKRWNIAADHVINLMLLERKFKMPKNGLADPQYTGMGTEEVYKLLPDCKHVKVDMDIVESEETNESLQQSVQDILVRAQTQARMQNDSAGSVPGDIQIFLNKLLKPKLPWGRILKRYLQSLAKADYSYKKFNRRFFPTNLLPSLYSHALMDIAIAVDTSGSVSPEDFTQFVSEINTIFKMMQPKKISLVQFDTEIKGVDEVRSVADLSKVIFTGQGGTNIDPVFDWANTNKPQLLMIFTDGFFRFSSKNTRIETLWLIHNNLKFSASTGKVIHYTI